MYACSPCNFKCIKRGDWNRHIHTSKHLSSTAPIQELKAENEQLKALVLEQQVELKKQYKQSSSPPRKTFHLSDFLNQDCRDALDWGDFVATFGEASEASDITTRVANALIEAAKRSGVHKRAVHCIDVKRKKLCVKVKGEWLQDDQIVETTIQDAVLQLQSDWMQKKQRTEQDWTEMEVLEVLQRISAPVDFSKFYSLVSGAVAIPKY